jgi:probable HAF family extracellular repeat protein
MNIVRLSVAAAACAAFVPAEAHALGYSVVDLGSLGGDTSQAFAINRAGQVAGTSSTLAGRALPYHAFLWPGRAPLIDLGTLGGAVAEATSINDNGAIAGYSTLPGRRGGYRAFLDTVDSQGHRTMANLGTLGGGYSVAYALNSSGEVVGQSALLNGGHRHRRRGRGRRGGLLARKHGGARVCVPEWQDDRYRHARQ